MIRATHIGQIGVRGEMLRLAIHACASGAATVMKRLKRKPGKTGIVRVHFHHGVHHGTFSAPRPSWDVLSRV